jgi:hypothetical protein
MNRLIFVSAALVTISSSAQAKVVKLRGAAADSFVAKYFPNAAVPGLAKGQFTYTNNLALLWHISVASEFLGFPREDLNDS